MPVEQAHAQRMLQLADGSGNVGLRCVEDFRCLAHAAGLHHRHEDVEILQFHSTSNAIAELHGPIHFDFEMISSENSLMRLWLHQIS
jgi:hypothetical protein